MPGRPAVRLRRRSVAPLAVAVLALGAACGSSPPVAVVGTTVAAASTAERGMTTPAPTIATTSAATTTVAPTVSVTTSVPASTTSGGSVSGADFEPACHAVAGSPAAAPRADAALDHFGPLGAHPAVVVDLPTAPRLTSTGEQSSERTAPAVQAAPVAGGVLVSVSPGSSSDLGRTMLAVVNLDGTVRWVRCFAAAGGQGVMVAPPASGAETALVVLADRLSYHVVSSTYVVVSLRTGETLGTSAADGPHWPELAALTGHWELNDRPGEVLFGHGAECCGAGRLDSIVRYDLATNVVRALEVPDETAGDSFATIELSAAGDPLVVEGMAVRAVFRDGSWHRDAATLAKVVPVRVDFAYTDASPVLQAVDGAGRRLWAAEHYLAPGLQGTGVWPDGARSIAQVCTRSQADIGCAAFALVAVATANGATVWTVPGIRHVVAVGDGYVLATDGPMFDPADPTRTALSTPGWELLDTRTGERAAADQHWPDPTTFQSECCGGGEWVWTRRAGAIVVNVVNTELRLWLPRDRTPAATVHTSLP